MSIAQNLAPWGVLVNLNSPNPTPRPMFDGQIRPYESPIVPPLTITGYPNHTRPPLAPALTCALAAGLIPIVNHPNDKNRHMLQHKTTHYTTQCPSYAPVHSTYTLNLRRAGFPPPPSEKSLYILSSQSGSHRPHPFRATPTTCQWFNVYVLSTVESAPLCHHT